MKQATISNDVVTKVMNVDECRLWWPSPTRVLTMNVDECWLWRPSPTRVLTMTVDECWLRYPFPTGVLMMMYISASFEAKVEEGMM